MQEPELLEQLYLGMGSYQGVGHMRLCSALRKANAIRKAAEAGTSSSSQAGLISDNTEVVQLLVRASEQYSQVSQQPYLLSTKQLRHTSSCFLCTPILCCITCALPHI